MLNNFTLLYVEDNYEMQVYMKDLIKDEFKEFYQAFDGKEGIELFKKYQPDIIISDINMPVMDGFKMAKEIKSLKYDQVILYFTTLTDIQDIQQAIDIHVNGFINKPLSSIEDFLEYVESKTDILKLKSVQKELDNLKFEKEKSDLIARVIRDIAHHWKQPLNAISLTASFLSYKSDNIILKEGDFEKMELIIEQVNKLTSVIEAIEDINTDKHLDINQISNILKIGNPIYE